MLARLGVPLASALIVAATLALAATRDRPGLIHTFPDASKRPPLRVVLKEIASPNAAYRYPAMRYLAFYRSDEAFDALVKGLEDRDLLIRLAALRGLLLRGDARAVPILEKVAFEDRHELVRHRAAVYAETLRDPFGQRTASPASSAY